MAKFKVLKPYKDLELDQKLKEGEEVEMTVKRSDEVAKTLKEKGYEGDFLERVDKPKK